VVRAATAELNKLHALPSSSRFVSIKDQLKSLLIVLRRRNMREISRDDPNCTFTLGGCREANPCRRVSPVCELHSLMENKCSAGRRYQYALGPIMRSLVTLIVMARFILTESLTPADTTAKVIGRESLSIS